MSRDFANYEHNLNILINILLARERSFNDPRINDPKINEFANQLISLPSMVFEKITKSLLPARHLSIFREWYVENRMRTLHHKLMYSRYRYNDLKNEHDDEKRTNLKQKLDAENQQINKEINELQPFYDLFSLRHTITNYTNELRRLKHDLNNLRLANPVPHQQRVEYLQEEIGKHKKYVENTYERNEKLKDYCFDPERGYSPKKCKAQTRNRSSGRCRKTPCRLGKIRDVTSGRCRSKKTSGRKSKSPSRKSSPKRKSIKPCRQDQVRNRSTGRCRRSKKLSANAYAPKRKHEDELDLSQVIFTQDFMDTMYDNMWTFMNPNMINHMFGFKISYQKDINNDIFTDDHKNTICFKGDPDGGHYVFVDDVKINVKIKRKNYTTYKHHGTYESKLLARDTDDGICHGAAIAFALNFIKGRADMFLKEFPTTVEDYKHNYKTILTVYIEIIENGKWDKALRANFYKDVKWIKRNKKNTTKETQEALKTLKTYIKRFD